MEPCAASFLLGFAGCLHTAWRPQPLRGRGVKDCAVEFGFAEFAERRHLEKWIVLLPTKTPRESKRSLQSCTCCNVVTAQAIRQSAIVSLPFPPYTRRPQQSAMSLRRGVLALALPVLAMVLAGCGCERDGMITCVADKTSQSHETCGVTAYSKVMSGETTVADCCVALKAVQDCYAVCSCDTECADEDKALACPTTGKVSDPIRFWELILAGLNKDGETCATAGVTGTQC